MGFTVTGKIDLEQDVKACLLAVERTNSYKYIRRLEIAGPGPYAIPQSEPNSKSGWRKAPCKAFGESLYEIHGANAVSKLEDRLGKVARWEDVPETSWQPLVQFIRQLPALTDVVWNCKQKVPPCLLEALQESASRCRLWVNTFGFSKLHESTLSVAEKALLSSPCLHALRLQSIIAWPSREGNSIQSGYDEDALRRVVAEMVPSLKRVIVGIAPPSAVMGSNPKAPWEGFASNIQRQFVVRGRLQSLSLRDNTATTAATMDEWSLLRT